MKTKSIEKKTVRGNGNGLARSAKSVTRLAVQTERSAAADRQAAEIARTFSVRWEW